MKDHILAALREQFDAWEALLSSLSSDQVAVRLYPEQWRITDVIMHLWAWQQRSIARIEAAVEGRSPEFPAWPGDPESYDEQSTNKVNAWIYATYQGHSWPEAHDTWRQGYLNLLESAQRIKERDLLDGNLYPWMNGSPLAHVLIATYDHHQEHREKLIAWLAEHQAL